MQNPSKLLSLTEAVGAIPPGATVALGTSPPLAALREILRQDRTDLSFVADGVAATLLAAAGFAVTPAPLDRLRAAALGLPFLPRPDPADPRGWTKATALHPDIALLHGRQADPGGRVWLTADILVAEAAKAVIATVELIVSDAAIDQHAGADILTADHVRCVAEAPYGAYPCAFPPLYVADPAQLARLDDLTRDARAFAAWHAGLVEHWDILDQIGARALLAVVTGHTER